MQGGFGPKIGIRKGDVLAGKYRVDWILGTGSTGVVLAAYHLKLHERVAIKLLLPEALANPEAVKRFEREARAAVRIKSQHVARVIDVGALEDGAPFIVMEHLQGEDLAARILRAGPLHVEEVVDFVMQACEAIAEAHGLGIVHRDLKPANLYCVRGTDGQPSIKVLDFGISKFRDYSDLHVVGDVTKTSVVVGSPFYMSPEQMQAPRTVDTRTDIWSLGVILYELLTGTVPFPGETLPQISVNVVRGPTPSVRQMRPEVPSGLDSVIARCLAKDPRRRYKSVPELATALGKYGQRKALSSVDRIKLTFKNASVRPFSVSLSPDGESARKVDAISTPPEGARTIPNRVAGRWRRLAAASIAVSMTGALLGIFWARRHDAKFALSAATPAAAPIAALDPALLQGRDESLQNAARPAETAPVPVLVAQPPPTGTNMPTPPKIRPEAARHGKGPSSRALPAEPSSDSTAAPRDEVYKGEGSCLLNLASTPSANIVLDNARLGSTPRSAVRVMAGAHTLRLRAPGGVERSTTVTCAPGEVRNLDLNLDDLPAVENAKGAEPPCPLCERP